MSLLSGKDRTLVGRPVFKTGGGASDVPGGFDSHPFPPTIE